MKKILYSLLIFVSIFFISSFDVKALSIDVNYSEFYQTFRFVSGGTNDINSCFEKTCTVGTNVESISFETYLTNVFLDSNHSYTLVYTFDINDLSTSPDNVSLSNVWTEGTNVINNLNTSYSYDSMSKQVVLTYNFSVLTTGTYNLNSTTGSNKDSNLYSKIFYNETNLAQNVTLNSTQFFYDVPSGFKDISPSVIMVETSSQISEDVNYTINNPSPYLSSGASTYDYIFNQFIPNELYSEYGEYYVCHGSGSAYSSTCYISDSPDVFTVQYGFNGSSTSPTFTYLSVYVNPTDEHKVYKYYITRGSKSSSSAYITSSTVVSPLYGDFNNSVYAPTNVPYFKMGDTTYNTIKTADGYMFNPGDIILYKDGTDFVVNTDYKTSLTPEPNVFEQQIDDKDYSKMIFEFDINSLTNRDYVLDLLYDFSTIGNLDLNGELYEEIGVGFPEPYLEVDYQDRFKDIIVLQSLNDSHNILKTVWAGTYQETITSDVVSLKLVIPMNATDNVRYDIGLISYIPYTYSFEYDQEVENYYAEIDLTNKYGVMFMPKLVENNSSITSTFIYDGIEKILLYGRYDFSDNLLKTYSAEDGAFSYPFGRYDLDYNLFFVTDYNSLNSYVKYDTRYFDYHIVDSKYSIGNVTNPNTGETHYIDFSNISSTSISFGSMSDVFEFIASNFDKDNNAYILFSDSMNIFFNTMPTDIYIFILTLLVIILIGTGLALGGWK